MGTQITDWIIAGIGETTRQVQYFQCPITGHKVAIISMKFDANLTLKNVTSIAVISGIVKVSFPVQRWPGRYLKLRHKDLQRSESLFTPKGVISGIRAISDALVIIWQAR